jgi:hypothetical protein
MGRQFSFYILPSETNLLVEQLRKRFEAKLLVDYSRADKLLEVDLPFRENAAGDMESISMDIRFYLAPSSSQIKRSYFPKPDWWVIDSDSEGIEFLGCKFNGKAVAIGRFLYEINVVRDLQYISKSTEFLKWAETVYRYTKSLLHYDRSTDTYFGKDAVSFREEGGQLARDIWPNGKVIPA